MPRIKGPSPEQIAEKLSSSPDGVTADLGFTLMIAYKVLAWFAVIPGVLGLRSRYGERYLTANTALFSWLIVAACSATTALTDMTSSRVQSYLGHAEESQGGAATGGVVLLAYSVMLFFRFGGVMLRRVKDDFTVHSHSDGNPWRLWYMLARLAPRAVRDVLVRCVMEPFAVFAGGATVAAITGSRLLGVLAFLTSLGFFMQQVLLQQEVRGKLLDAADAAIEAEELRSDRTRLQEGEAEQLVFAPPRARSALSSLGLEQLQAARLAAQRAGTALPAHATAPVLEKPSQHDAAAE